LGRAPASRHRDRHRYPVRRTRSPTLFRRRDTRPRRNGATRSVRANCAWRSHHRRRARPSRYSDVKQQQRSDGGRDYAGSYHGADATVAYTLDARALRRALRVPPLGAALRRRAAGARLRTVAVVGVVTRLDASPRDEAPHCAGTCNGDGRACGDAILGRRRRDHGALFDEIWRQVDLHYSSSSSIP